MGVSKVRRIAAVVISILLPLSMSAADGPSAVLHHNGGVWVNGAEVADATAIFAGDTIETKPGFVANLNVTGSSILIQGESIVRFENNFVTLDHGSVEVGTATEFSVHVDCIQVVPIHTDRTQYDVADLSGRVDVSALKNDVSIRYAGHPGKVDSSSDGESNIVREGHQDTRYVSTACGVANVPQSPTNGINPKVFEIGGGAGGAAVLCLLLCKGKGSSSVSPTQP